MKPPEIAGSPAPDVRPPSEPGLLSSSADASSSPLDVARLMRNPAVEAAIRGVEQNRAQVRQMIDAAQVARPMVPPDLVERARALIASPALQAVVESHAAAQRDMLARFRAIATPSHLVAIQGLQERAAEIAEARHQLLNSAAMKAVTNYQNQLRARWTDTVEAFNRFRPALGAFVAEQARALAEGRSLFHWALAKELSERGWWLVPTWPAPLLIELGRGIAQRHGRRVVDETLLAHYRYKNGARLGEALRRWTQPEFIARQRTFREALAHHRKRRFRVAILMVTPHVEGVVKDFLLAEGLLTPKQAWRGKTPALVEAHLARQPGHASHPGFVKRLQRLYSDFTWGLPPTRTGVARHSLSHGAASAPNSEIESLQVFLMLDTLHYFLSDLRERRGSASGSETSSP